MKKKQPDQKVKPTLFFIEDKNSLTASVPEICRKLTEKKKEFKSDDINQLIELVCYILENIENVFDNEFNTVKGILQDIFDLFGNPLVNKENIESEAFIIFVKLELFKPRQAAPKIIITEKEAQVQILVFDLDKISSDIKEFINDFIMEADEFVEKIEEDLLKLEEGEDPEILNRLFRAMHTLKGGAGTIEFEAIQVIAHRAENIMDKVRNKELFFSPEIIDTLFKSLDILKYCLNQLRTSDVVTVDVGEIVQKLDAIIEDSASSEIQIHQQQTNTHQPAVQKFINVQKSSLPSQPNESDKFKNVENDSALTLKTNEMNNPKGFSTTNEFSGADKLQKKTAAVETTQKNKTNNNNISDEKKVEDIASDGSATTAAAVATPTVNEEKKVLRVEAEKLDTLMNMAGELVISKIMIENGFHHLKIFYSELGEINAQFTETSDFEKITDIISRYNKSFRAFAERITKIELANTTLNRLTTGIQQAILKTRLVPLSSVFNRYNRLVRDLSKSLNKDINFIVEGAETEVDKIIVEVIGDPIVHIIRNSLDHGIETPEIRLDKGKTGQGTLKLKAYYEGEQVVIEISDDGKGINAEDVAKSMIMLYQKKGN